MECEVGIYFELFFIFKDNSSTMQDSHLIFIFFFYFILEFTGNHEQEANQEGTEVVVGTITEQGEIQFTDKVTCSRCQKVFANPSNRRAHELTHTQE